MFRSSAFDKLIDKATSHLMMEPDWTTVLQICDSIRQNDVQPKQALAAVKKKILLPNPHSAMFAVQLLESMVKNCGVSLHEELTTKSYCESLAEIVKTTPHEEVRQKMLELIQGWSHAFRKTQKYGALREMMNGLKEDGFKFPVLRESDAMYSADSAPMWADGEVCHRCRTAFSLILRKHHCRACGQVFCQQCSSRTSTLPKFGIEKEVRVCDACYDQVSKAATASSAVAGKDADMAEYLKSSLAQQSQAPPRKTEEEIREEEELELALALSQSEAEQKEKDRSRGTSAYSRTNDTVQPVRKVDRSPSPPDEQQANPELARYLNRSHWEAKQMEFLDNNGPSAPAATPSITTINTDLSTRENGIVDNQIDEFLQTLKTQVEIFINRMKSNSSRGRSIATDSSVQTLFMNITSMHSRLLRYIQQHDDSRLYYERLQDKLTQVKDARAALDALREEHWEKMRRQAEEAERQRQMLMAQKLDIMRKKKQEYLQYQRQLALQRIQEQEREMQMRQEQQKQQYSMGPQFFMGSPIHGQQFLPNQSMLPQSAGPFPYQYGGPQPMMPPMGPPTIQQNPQQINHPPNSMQMQPPPGFPPRLPPQNVMQQPNQNFGPMSMMPPSGQIPNQNIQPPPPQMQNMQQPGAPPASPQIPHNPNLKHEDSQTAELISFD